MLVTVQFPGNLRVADFLEVEVLHLEPRHCRAALAVHQVEVPIDLRTVVQNYKDEKIKAARANSLGACHDGRSNGRELLLEDRTQGFNLGRREEEPSLRGERLRKFSRKVLASCTAEGIDSSHHLLSRTVEEFHGAHRPQPAQAACQS